MPRVGLKDLRGRAEHLFVVRIWSEHDRAEPLQWRGCIDHVQSGKKLYFAKLGDIMDFIALRTGGSVKSEP
jgi:hypothetical protein